MIRSISCLCLVLPWFAAAAEPAAVSIPAPLPLDWCLERAAQTSPDIAQASALAEAAQHRVRPSASLDDPRFSYDASNVPVRSFDFDSTMMSGHQLGLRQKLPFPGLLSQREAAAQSGADAAEAMARDRRLVVARAVETAWAELGFAQAALRVTDRNIALLRQLAATAEARYGVGAGLQQDVMRAQVELTGALGERLRREAAVSAAEARLVELLDLPALTALPQTEALTDGAGAPALDPLLSQAEETNAALRALREAVAQARAQVRVAELEGYPDIDLGVGYRLRASVPGDPVAGQDFLSAGATLRLPVDRSKWRALVAEKRALLRRAEAEYRAAQAAVGAALRRAHADLVRASAEAELLRTGLVPQAGQSLESSRSGYEVGRIDFLSLLDSQVQLYDAELRLTRARADAHIAFAALEAAAGRTIR